MRLRGAISLLLTLARITEALDNGLGLTPQLGFNSWNSFQTHVNESVMRDTIDAFVNLGLRDAGYEYVSIDDWWAAGRLPDGTIEANRTTFPSGIKALADYAHERRLKFGLYSSNSPKTCGQWPGSFGYEALDAKTYAEWGVDLLKYDNCGNQKEIGPPEQGYAVMRDALNATGRPMFFAACEWAVDFPATWMVSVANTWRTTYDIQNYWDCVVSHADWTNIYADFAKPGAFNDMDILEVGNPSPGAGGGLTKAEAAAHFSLWAVMKAPLMVGCDLSTQTCRDALPIFLNRELLAVNQDKLGKQAKRLSSSEPLAISKSGMCRKEEQPQNTIIAPCDANSPLQQWTLLAAESHSWSPHSSNWTGVEIHMSGARAGVSSSSDVVATTECLQLDSGQGGDCNHLGLCNGGQQWSIWTNNAASALCNDPALCCPEGQHWDVDVVKGTVKNSLTGHCLTVHQGGMHNVGLSPCSTTLQGFQTWDFQPTAAVRGGGTTGMFVFSATPPGGVKSCLARTDDVRAGAREVWGGPLDGGDHVLLLFNRDISGSANITARWADLGLDDGAKMTVRDLWSHTEVGVFSKEFTAEAEEHGVRVFRLSPSAVYV